MRELYTIVPDVRSLTIHSDTITPRALDVILGHIPRFNLDNLSVKDRITTFYTETENYLAVLAPRIGRLCRLQLSDYQHHSQAGLRNFLRIQTIEDVRILPVIIL